MENAGAAIVLAAPDTEPLRAAISQAFNDTKMRTEATQMANEMAAMPSVEDAVRELEDMV